MATITKVFKSGNSQAVRIPKKFRVTAKELEIEKRGNELILREKPEGMTRAFHLLTELVNLDALKNRKKDPPQKRKGL
jgi:antitoxin VapB